MITALIIVTPRCTQRYSETSHNKESSATKASLTLQLPTPKTDASSPSDSFSQLIKHPTPEEVSNGSARRGEYFIAWKVAAVSSLSSPGQEEQLITRQLRERYVDTQIMSDLYGLAQIPWIENHLTAPTPQNDQPHSSWGLSTFWERRSQDGLAKIEVQYPDTFLTVGVFSSYKKAKNVLERLASQGKIWFAEPHFQTSFSQINDEEAAEEAAEEEEGTSDPDALLDELLLPWPSDDPPQQYDLDNIDLRFYAQFYGEEYQDILPYHVTAIRLNKALEYLAQLPSKDTERILKNPPIIAVLDSGVDVQHPALIVNLVDFSGDHHRGGARACGGDRYGCNTTAPPRSNQLGHDRVYPVSTEGFDQRCPLPSLSDPSSDKKINYCRHGTHVAGLAVGFTPELIFGACPFCRYVPVRIVDENLQIYDSSIVRALHYASLVRSDDGARVQIINASFGKSQMSLTVSTLIRYLAKEHNILVIAAAGNTRTLDREYPGSLEDVLAVTALMDQNISLPEATVGSWVGVAAPGKRLPSSVPGRSWDYDSGTSMATPLVSGVAGLILAASKRSLSARELREIIERSADNSALYKANPDYQGEHKDKAHARGILGRGIVNAYAAVTSPLLQTPFNPANERIGGGCATLRTHPRAGLLDDLGGGKNGANQRIFWWLWLGLGGVAGLIRSRCGTLPRSD